MQFGQSTLNRYGEGSKQSARIQSAQVKYNLNSQSYKKRQSEA